MSPSALRPGERGDVEQPPVQNAVGDQLPCVTRHYMAVAEALEVAGAAAPGPSVFPDAGPVMPIVTATAAVMTAPAFNDRLRKMGPAQE